MRILGIDYGDARIGLALAGGGAVGQRGFDFAHGLAHLALVVGHRFVVGGARGGLVGGDAASVPDRQRQLQRAEGPGGEVGVLPARAQLQRRDVAAQAERGPARSVGGVDLGARGQQAALGGPHVGALAQGVGGQGCY